jgi:DNA-binding GntR family transcriptional regulator
MANMPEIPGTSGRARVVHFDPIPQENLTDHVYRAIKERIVAQEIEVGSRLRDEELAVQLGVSRTPVREALMRLHRDGLVQIVPRSGTRVRTFTEQDIEQIFDLRIALESLAIQKATSRLTDDEIARLRTLHERAETALKSGNTRPALDFDHEMHAAIIKASGSTRLQEFMATINDYVALFRNLGARTPFHRGYTYRHREIVRALERRDPVTAVRALSEHIQAARTELFRDIRQRRGADRTPMQVQKRRQRK